MNDRFRLGEARSAARDVPRSYVRFLVGDVAYAVDVAAVREIVTPSELIALPHLPPSVLGVFEHRDEVVPVVSMRKRFGLDPATPKSSKWILVASGDRTVGLATDAVTEVFSTSQSSMREAPRVGGDSEQRGVDFAVTHDTGLVFVLSLPTLLASVESALAKFDASTVQESLHE